MLRRRNSNRSLRRFLAEAIAAGALIPAPPSPTWRYWYDPTENRWRRHEAPVEALIWASVRHAEAEDVHVIRAALNALPLPDLDPVTPDAVPPGGLTDVGVSARDGFTELPGPQSLAAEAERITAEARARNPEFSDRLDRMMADHGHILQRLADGGD